ncbi:M20/M25/M40 family metallo-hydrolase [Thalassotalea fusca]
MVQIISRVLFVLVALNAAVVEAKNQLTPTELDIRTAVEKVLPNAVKELQQAININSGSMNFAGVRKVGDLYNKQLSEIGFHTEWLDGRDFNRAGHLVAVHKSKDENAPKILLIGHLDTVFAEHDEFQQWQLLDEHTLQGPGANDMKGGNTIIVTAMRALKEVGLLSQMNIAIVMTGDEESSGRPLSKSKAAIVEYAKWADIALGFESGDSDIRTAMAGRRGYVGWTLEIKAKSAHSSRLFTDQVGYGAIYESARILSQFREQLSEYQDLTYNPGMIIGGTRISHDTSTYTGEAFGKSNVIAASAKVTGDIRATSSAQFVEAKHQMERIVAAAPNHIESNITFSVGYPPMAVTSGNTQLLALYSQVSEDLGYNKVSSANPRNAGAADISFAAEHVDMAIDGIGMMGSGAHTKDEVGDLQSFHKNIEKAAVLLHRLTLSK